MANNKLREAIAKSLGVIDHLQIRYSLPKFASDEVAELKSILEAALAAPARNCDKVKDHSDAIGKFEKWMNFSPKTADEQDAFFKEHWFEFAMWLIDMNESEVYNG